MQVWKAHDASQQIEPYGLFRWFPGFRIRALLSMLVLSIFLLPDSLLRAAPEEKTGTIRVRDAAGNTVSCPVTIKLK